MASGYIYMVNNQVLPETSDISVRVYWKSTQHSAALTSDLTMTYQIKRTNAEADSGYCQSFCKINFVGGRSNVSETKYAASPLVQIPTNKWLDIATFNVPDLKHNPGDGTGEAYLLPESMVYFYNPTNSTRVEVGTVRITDNTTMAFDTINVAAYVSSAPNFTEKDNPTIKIANPHNARDVYACISLTGAKDDIAYRPVSGSSYTFNLTEEERALLINSVSSGASRDVRFYVRSNQGYDNFYRYATRTFSLTDALPNLTEMAVVDMNPTTQELTGDITKLIKYHSIAAAQCNSIAKYDATIVSERITNGGITKEKGLAAFENVESNVFTFEATDSRGNVGKEELTVPMVEYFNPTCHQKIEIGFDTETTAKISLEITGTFFNDSFGAVENDIEVQFRRKENDGEWTAWTSVSDIWWETYKDGNSYRVSGNITGLDYEGEQTLQSRVIDKLATIESAEYTTTITPIFDWGKEDFTFNVPVKIKGDLEVEGTIINGKETEEAADRIIETGTEAMGTNGTWYWEKWSSGKAVCWGTRNFGNMSISTSWSGWYESAGFTQNFPTGLFTAAPDSLQINVAKSSNGLMVSQGWGNNLSATSTGTFSLARPGSMNVSQVHLSFHAIGRWK